MIRRVSRMIRRVSSLVTVTGHDAEHALTKFQLDQASSGDARAHYM